MNIQNFLRGLDHPSLTANLKLYRIWGSVRFAFEYLSIICLPRVVKATVKETCLVKLAVFLHEPVFLHLGHFFSSFFLFFFLDMVMPTFGKTTRGDSMLRMQLWFGGFTADTTSTVAL